MFIQLITWQYDSVHVFNGIILENLINIGSVYLCASLIALRKCWSNKSRTAPVRPQGGNRRQWNVTR